MEDLSVNVSVLRDEVVTLRGQLNNATFVCKSCLLPQMFLHVILLQGIWIRKPAGHWLPVASRKIYKKP